MLIRDWQIVPIPNRASDKQSFLIKRITRLIPGPFDFNLKMKAVAKDTGGSIDVFISGEGIVQPEFIVDPSKLFLGPRKVGTTALQKIEVRSLKRTPFRIKDVTWDKNAPYEGEVSQANQEFGPNTLTVKLPILKTGRQVFPLIISIEREDLVERTAVGIVEYIGLPKD